MCSSFSLLSESELTLNSALVLRIAWCHGLPLAEYLALGHENFSVLVSRTVGSESPLERNSVVQSKS
jgi:hypothetical protein